MKLYANTVIGFSVTAIMVLPLGIFKVVEDREGLFKTLRPKHHI